MFADFKRPSAAANRIVPTKKRTTAIIFLTIFIHISYCYIINSYLKSVIHPILENIITTHISALNVQGTTRILIIGEFAFFMIFIFSIETFVVANQGDQKN